MKYNYDFLYAIHEHQKKILYNVFKGIYNNIIILLQIFWSKVSTAVCDNCLI